MNFEHLNQLAARAKGWRGHRAWALAALMPLALGLTACGGGGGGSAAPPTNVRAQAGDGRITVSFDAVPGVSYWLFTAADPAITVNNWLGLQRARSVTNAVSPQIICGLVNDLTYYSVINGRTGDGAGGAGSPAVQAPTRSAGGSWQAGTGVTDRINAVAFAPRNTCVSVLNVSEAATGVYAAAGDGGALYTSNDGLSWTKRNAPAGVTTRLNDVAVATLRLNQPGNYGHRFVAVGDGGLILNSSGEDGASWTVVRPFDSSQPALRSVTEISAVFVAVGNRGTVLQSTDGISWTTQAAPTTEDIVSVITVNNLFYAFTASGVVLTSATGTVWVPFPIGSASSGVRGITFGNYDISLAGANVNVRIATFVAVGDNGLVWTSTDGGTTWTAQTLPGNPNLVAVKYTSQFVAIDSLGRTYTSRLGSTWSGPNAPALGAPTDMIDTGYGFVVAGDGRIWSSF